MPKDRACNCCLLNQPILHSICAGNVLKERAKRKESTPLHVHFTAWANRFLSMFRQLWVFHHWRRIKVYLQVSSKKATKQCRSFASITRGALKWSIIYYLTKPNGSNNNKGNEADVQDLPFLSTSCRAGAAATLSPQPDTAPTHALGEHSLVPPCVAAYCVFIPPLRTMWVPLSDTQELCPNGLISEGGIWIKLWLAQPQQHCQLCTSVDPSPDAPQSLIPL